MDKHTQLFSSWQALQAAPRSRFFRGTPADSQHDRLHNGKVLLPSVEAAFTQSNARVLVGQAADGRLRFVAMPTCVYPAPTQTGEFGLGPGMYHHFDVAMYVGDLTYQLALEGSTEPVALAADNRQNESWYADHFLPMTHTREGNLELCMVSLAPVAAEADKAPLAPAPLPGPAGALYILVMRNVGQDTVRGKVILQAGDLLVGHYEDADPALRPYKQPGVDLRQHTLILTRPEGSVGIHLHQGRWSKLTAPFQAERAFELKPGEELAIETHLALGKSHSEVMREIFALHLSPALDWLNRTASFWHERLGVLEVDAADDHEGARLSQEIYVRSLLDNFNCLQTDAAGNLIAHWQGAPSHGYGTVWGIDVEPTAVSVVHICPEITWKTLLFFMERSQAPKGPPDHSVPILVAPLIIARQWLQVTGDLATLRSHPEALAALEGILRHLLALESPVACLFPSRYSSDGVVGRRYDYGANVKVWYALDSMAYIYRQLGQEESARCCQAKADAVRQAIAHTMIAEGPFGPQISGGTNLGEDAGKFYLPEGVFYYDGEDTSSMLAPVYGMCGFSDLAWVNYHRFARSLWHAGYDPEFDTLYWHPGEPAVLDGTAYFSRLGGSVTRQEMIEALKTLREVAVDDVTGSVFWWPHGIEFKRALTRCSQGQGAWAWQYLYQWLGLKVDAANRHLTFAPRGLLTRVDWQEFRAGAHRFALNWEERETESIARIRNLNTEAWTIQVGFRQPGLGACDSFTWQSLLLAPGEEAALSQSFQSRAVEQSLGWVEMIRREVQAFGDADGIIFKRYGPAMLWGHWNAERNWVWNAMPLALRFVIVNGAGEDWSHCTVELHLPAGWQAQGRQPRHWTPPDALVTGNVSLDVGSLAAGSRTVAAFWLQPEPEFRLRIQWDDPNRPFHEVSQPGEGWLLRTADLEQPVQFEMQARLSARATSGARVDKTLIIPVSVIPYHV